LPAFSSAIVDGMLENFSQLCGIDYGICAGVKSGVGGVVASPVAAINRGQSL
jgi:hypothetical protein